MLFCNLLATFAVVLWALANGSDLPTYAVYLALEPAAAFLAAIVWSRPDVSGWRRDVAAALNGASMLLLSGGVVMCIIGVLQPFALLVPFTAVAGLSAWNLARCTEADEAHDAGSSTHTPPGPKPGDRATDVTATGSRGSPRVRHPRQRGGGGESSGRLSERQGLLVV